jgi:4'-phosphopantetheinyl transferase EntD
MHGRINEAIRCRILDNLSPPIYLSELLQHCTIDNLHWRERNLVQQMSMSRARDFSAGRDCARYGLRLLGISDFALLPGPDGSPVWPEGIVGSITHVDSYFAAAVCRKSDYLGIGIDAAIRGSAEIELARTICTRQEYEWLTKQPRSLQSELLTILFSAKEAFYKCQYCLTHDWLDFQDVQIVIEGLNYVATCPRIRESRPILGRYEVSENYVHSLAVCPKDKGIRSGLVASCISTTNAK